MYLITIPVLSIEKRNVSSSSGTVMFPTQYSSQNYSNTNIDVLNYSIQIPASLVLERAGHYGLLVYYMNFLVF